MRFLSLSLGLVVLASTATVAMANEYKFMCKNLFWVSQLQKLEAKTENEARFKLKHDKAFKDYSACTYQGMLTDEQRKKAESQDTWGSRFKTKVQNALQVPQSTNSQN